ncbi:MAG: hypothetical protein PHN75_12975 [Syntrophales bacterium]|nr:hypothetical protein [Syntrophales bacterium]
MNGKKCRRVVSILFLILLLTACASSSNLVSLNSYLPEFNADLSAYKGKRVYLMNFDNQDWNTTNFSYFSPDRQFTYSSNSLIHNYFWYSFERAFVSMDMLVSNAEKPDPAGVPIWLTLKSITDDRYEVDVKIRIKENMIFIKTYSMSGDPVAEGNRNPEFMEKRAYGMTNRLIQTILTDPAFKEAFFRTSAELASMGGK